MGSAERRKGANAERAVVEYLRRTEFPYAERRQSGTCDEWGDITGTPGIVWEVKNHRQITPAAFIDQLVAEMAAADVGVGTVVAKRPGRSDVGDWYAMMPVSVYMELLRQAGWTHGG